MSRDVGTSGVFSRVVEEDTLTFEPVAEGRFRDLETGSVWDITGRALEGPRAGTQLRRIPHGDYFWFAWAAFRPETEIRGG